MSISGAFAASSRMGVARGVQRLSPARARKSPVAVWVRGSMMWGRPKPTPHFELLPVDAQPEFDMPRCVDLASVVDIVGAQHAEVGRVADVQVRIAQLRMVQQV